MRRPLISSTMLVYVKEARRHGRSKEEDVTLPPRHAP
jgi:hypothetical protein